MGKGPKKNAGAHGFSSSQFPGEGPPDAFADFSAAELFCPNCKQSMPVRERLLLVLPGGDLFEYVCLQCGASIGKKTGG